MQLCLSLPKHEGSVCWDQYPNKTSYELFRNRTPNVSHLKVFGCRCYIHNNGKDNLKKFDPRSNEGVFLGYAKASRAFRVFNNRIGNVEESIHVVFDESTFGEIKNYNSSSDGDFPQMEREESDGENDSNDRSRSTSSRHNDLSMLILLHQPMQLIQNPSFLLTLKRQSQFLKEPLVIQMMTCLPFQTMSSLLTRNKKTIHPLLSIQG